MGRLQAATARACPSRYRTSRFLSGSPAISRLTCWSSRYDLHTSLLVVALREGFQRFDLLRLWGQHSKAGRLPTIRVGAQQQPDILQEHALFQVLRVGNRAVSDFAALLNLFEIDDGEGRTKTLA